MELNYTQEYSLIDLRKSWLELDINKSQGDHALFIKYFTDDKISVLVIYIDDIIIAYDNNNNNKRVLQKKIVENFEIMKLCKLKYFIDVELAQLE